MFCGDARRSVEARGFARRGLQLELACKWGLIANAQGDSNCALWGSGRQCVDARVRIYCQTGRSSVRLMNLPSRREP